MSNWEIIGKSEDVQAEVGEEAEVIYGMTIDILRQSPAQSAASRIKAARTQAT
jgi:hypothetical protein